MRVLIIEDDALLAYALAFHLRQAGFDVETQADGLSGLEAATLGGHDLILLDRMLPGLDGTHVLRRLRQQRIATPVLIITAMTGVHDRVEGLDAGADDYLVKPFATEELLARVRALSRRAPQLNDDLLQYGNITLHEDKGLLQGESGASCPISKREASLLAQFLRSPGRTLPRDLIMTRVWGDAPIEGGNVDNFIYFVRKRLKVVGANCKIANVRGLGFRLERL